MVDHSINDKTLATVELSDDERFELAEHLQAIFFRQEETILLLEHCRDAHARVQWKCVETIVLGRGWDMAEGEEKDLPTYRIYGRMVHLGNELDEVMAQVPGCALRLAAIQLRVRQLLDETIVELRAQMRRTEERVAAEWLVKRHSEQVLHNPRQSG